MKFIAFHVFNPNTRSRQSNFSHTVNCEASDINVVTYKGKNRWLLLRGLRYVCDASSAFKEAKS